MVRLLSAAWVLVLVALWVEAAAGEDQATAGSAPVVSLRTLITGTCQEIQRHAESILGTTVIQSTAEVQRTTILHVLTQFVLFLNQYVYLITNFQLLSLLLNLSQTAPPPIILPILSFSLNPFISISAPPLCRGFLLFLLRGLCCFLSHFLVRRTSIQ